MAVAGIGDDEWSRRLSEQIRHNGRLFFRLAYGVVRNPAAAEDACQHAFLRAWENRGRIEAEEGVLKAWMTRTVINESLQLIRRSKTEQRVLADQAFVGATESVSIEERSAVREAVVRGIEQLPEPVRTVVVLRLLDGMTGGEVKGLLGCSDAEVSKQLHRGMDQLRILLADVEVERV